ncbi:3-hydroxyacyl-CoA dehydrogenase NAD-binding domain-containing protein [Litorivivens sp.]|uniref:3-hydroxyacyl-CoA dehydrogenase NAD-binding domain-containing protein n=1 Tax=Litorivivens sp. TaxID=2020868 RepID=UPI00356AAD72
MTVAEFDRVTFVGGGTMGCFNSLLAAVSGYEAVIYDLDEQVLAAVPLVQEAIGAHLIDIGYCSAADLEAAYNRVSVQSDLALAVQGAGLVSESVPERLTLKRDVFAQLDALCSSEVLLTSNTSALLVSDMDSAIVHGERFAALHSHFGALLFDIVAGPRCGSNNVELLVRYVRSLSAEPLVLRKEFPGYVFNALLGSVLSAAKWEVINGRATIEEIDRAWMAYFAAPFGPFGLMDLFGLDVVADSWREPREDPVRTARQPQVSAFLQTYLDAGRLGRKTAAGFYDYPEAAFMASGFTDKAETERLAPLLTALIDTAITIESQGVASSSDIDRAWCTALGMKQGPFSLRQDATTGQQTT